MIGNIESSTPEKIEQVKGVCVNLKVRVSADESSENLDNNFTLADRINTLIINSLAVKLTALRAGNNSIWAEQQS